MTRSTFWIWLVRIFKKWIWALGLIPLFLDYVSALIPNQTIQKLPFLADFLNTGTTWQISLIFFSVGLFISTYLVYAEVENRLKVYEYHEPKYLIEIVRTDVGTCQRGCHVSIECTIKIEPTNPWTGFLTKVFIKGDNQLTGLSDWKINGAFVNNSIFKPQEIRAPKLDLDVKIESAIDYKTKLVEKEWNEVAIPINILIGYVTTPVGEMDISKDLVINANLAGVYPSALNYQKKQLERMAEESTYVSNS
jgi:hypothetical protein